MKKLLLILFGILIATRVYGADINDWIRGDGTDAVEGDETISTLDDQITNYLQDPLDLLLSNYIRGAIITVTSDTVLTISAGELVTTTAAGVHRFRKNTSTATVDNTAADVGGLDTGSVAADTWYAVWGVADADSDNFTLILSTSFSAPTNAAALHYALIGAALTDATSDWLKAYYIGDGNTVTVMWDIPINETTTVSSAAWSGALDCSSSIPSISTLGIFGIFVEDAAPSYGNCWIRPNGSTWSTQDSNSVGALQMAAGQRFCMTDSSQQIQHREDSDDTSVRIDVEGFVFTR